MLSNSAEDASSPTDQVARSLRIGNFSSGEFFLHEAYQEETYTVFITNQTKKSSFGNVISVRRTNETELELVSYQENSRASTIVPEMFDLNDSSLSLRKANAFDQIKENMFVLTHPVNHVDGLRKFLLIRFIKKLSTSTEEQHILIENPMGILDPGSTNETQLSVSIDDFRMKGDKLELLARAYFLFESRRYSVVRRIELDPETARITKMGNASNLLTANLHPSGDISNSRTTTFRTWFDKKTGGIHHFIFEQTVADDADRFTSYNFYNEGQEIRGQFFDRELTFTRNVSPLVSANGEMFIGQIETEDRVPYVLQYDPSSQELKRIWTSPDALKNSRASFELISSDNISCLASPKIVVTGEFEDSEAAEARVYTIVEPAQ